MSALAVAPAPLTARQRQVLDFLYSFTLEHGYQPGARQILAHLGSRSLNSYTGHLRGLERAGYVLMSRHRTRSLDLLLWPDGAPFRGFARPAPESVATPESYP